MICKQSTIIVVFSNLAFTSNIIFSVADITLGLSIFFFPSFILHFIQIAPVIMSKPDDSYGPLGANLTLDCEARGHPAPTITWRFVNTEGKTIALPSKFY